MDKARICVKHVKHATKSKTIKGGQKLLVYEKTRKRPEQQLKKIYNLGNINPPVVKKIRVCTGAELKKMCPRTPPCKPPPPPDDSLALIARLLWFTLKAAIAGGLVLFTYQAGVWGNNDDTQALWERACAYFSPKSEEEDEEELGDDFKIVLGYCNQNKIFMEEIEKDTGCPLPTDESNLYYIQRKWNELIIEIGDVMLAGPVSWACSFGNWISHSDDPDVEEKKKRARELSDKKKAVEEYNIRVSIYEEKKLKEREERINALKKRYHQRLRIMKQQQDEEYGVESNDVPEVEEEESAAAPQSACSS